MLDRWNVAVSEDMRAGDLKVEARQLVEIARALSYGARFIILDEPTAQLDGDEIKRLFARMRELQAQGVTFLFISHHLQEVYEICQAVTVLRDARHIVSAPGRRPAQGPADRGDDRRAGATSASPTRPAGRSRRARAVALEVERPRRRGFRRCQLHRPRAARCSAFPARPAAAGSASPRRSPASGAYTGGAIRINGRAAAARRRAGGARARRRLRAEEPARAGPRPDPVGRRQHHDDDRRPLGPLGFIAPRRQADVPRRRDRRRSASSPRARTSWSRPLRRQPAEGRDGPGARQRARRSWC